MDALVLTNSKGQDVTTSLIVAEVFRKRHDSVLRDIKDLSCSPEFRAHNFVDSSYNSQQNKYMPMFEITKDGFSFLVMGYNGNKAAQFKETFINEFNKRDALLKNPDYIISQAMSIMFERVKSVEQQLKQKEERLQLQEHEIQIAAPKVEYYDNVLQSDSKIATTVIAKELGMSGQALNKLLKARGIIYKVNDVYVLTAKYQDKGYSKPKTVAYTRTNGEIGTKIELYWTERGRQFIHGLLKVKVY